MLDGVVIEVDPERDKAVGPDVCIHGYVVGLLLEGEGPFFGDAERCGECLQPVADPGLVGVREGQRWRGFSGCSRRVRDNGHRSYRRIFICLRCLDRLNGDRCVCVG